LRPTNAGFLLLPVVDIGIVVTRTEPGRKGQVPHLNGLVIRRARLGKGMTLRDVSAECDRRGVKVDASNLARAEQGRPGGLGPHKLPILAEVLGLSMDELIPDEEGAAA
jgi:hypothetical protein